MRRQPALDIVIQSLEARRMLAAVTVTGGSGSDSIHVYVQSNTIVVDVNDIPSSYPDFLYDGIVINSLGGDDTILISSNGENPITVNSGSGPDDISIGELTESLDGIESDIFLNSSGDRLLIHSEADAGDGTYTITDSTITKAGYPAIHTNAIGTVLLFDGAGTDTFVVGNAASGTRYELHGGGDDDVFDVRNTNGATVVVDGYTGFDRVILNSDINGAAAIQFEQSQDLDRIDATAGGRITVTGGFGIYLSTNLSDFEGDLFLETGFLIEHNSQAAGGLGYWRQRLLDAQTNVTPQVRSTFADNSAANDTVGYAYAQNTALTELAGFALTSGDLLLRYTLRGDVNLSGNVDFDDLLILAQNYSDTATGKFWHQGDFDLNGNVNFDDLLSLAQTYGTSTTRSSRSLYRAVLRELA